MCTIKNIGVCSDKPTENKIPAYNMHFQSTFNHQQIYTHLGYVISIFIDENRQLIFL